MRNPPSLKLRHEKIPEYVYTKRLQELQLRLSLVQHAYLARGERAVVVLEGVDAAGKGGLIRRLAWALDPRGFKVWPIGAPTKAEMAYHYLHRFWSKLPARGEIAVFDRSWYGRVLVERVEDLARPAEYKRAYGEINEFERTLTDDGTRVIKLFLHIGRDEQLTRFKDRLKDPEKRWKLSYEDFRNRAQWDTYLEAFETMFKKTSTKASPWRVVANNDKHSARIEALEYLVERLGKDIDVTPPKVDPRLRKLLKKG